MIRWLLGYEVFDWIATWANPTCDVLFRVVTDIGNTPLYFLILAPLFWVADRRRALVLFVLLALSSYLNTFLKLWFDMPRPDPALARVLDPRPALDGSNGFPSGHAQNALVFWGYLAWWLARRWATAAAAVMVGLISFSRLYLGVHFPLDIAGGLLLGSAHLSLIPILERWGKAEFPLPALGWGWIAASGVVLLLTTVDRATAALAGSTVGMSVAVGLLWPPQIRVAGAGTALATVAAGLVLMSTVIGIVLIPLGAISPLPLGAALALAWIVSLGLYPRAVAAVAPRYVRTEVAEHNASVGID